MVLPLPSLKRDGSSPLYYQIKENLSLMIKKGLFKPGDKLPTEKELAAGFDVSDITVKKALKELELLGLITRKPGKGTFVKTKSLSYPLFKFTNFVEQIRQQGHQPYTKVLRFDKYKADKDVVHYLQKKEGTEVLILERLRFADKTPLVYQTSYIISEVGNKITKTELERRSLYEMLRDISGIWITKVREELQAIILPPFESKMLNVKKGSPGFFSNRIAYLKDDVPVVYDRVFVRGDKLILVSEAKAE